MSNWHNRIECVWCGMLVTQSCLTLCDPVDCSLLGSSVLGILQATILEWVVNSFSRGSSPPRDQIQVSCFASGFFTIWATREVFIYIHKDFIYIYIYIYIYISQLYSIKLFLKKRGSYVVIFTWKWEGTGTFAADYVFKRGIELRSGEMWWGCDNSKNIPELLPKATLLNLRFAAES